MSLKNMILAALIVLASAGCVCVSPDQAVNISELHDGITRLMPFAAAGIKAQIEVQEAIANDTSRTQAEREAATKTVVELQGRFLETKLLPGVSAPICSWAIAKVGSDTYLEAKAKRDAQIGGSGGTR